MNFKECLKSQITLHPSIEPRDVVKMCYQAAYGAEHLLSDVEAARTFFEEEYAKTNVTREPLWEQISEEICRVNYGAWKDAGLEPGLLFDIFLSSFGDLCQNQEELLKNLEQAEEVLAEEAFDMAGWRVFLKEYKASGMKALHYSQNYREHEKPAYRIVRKNKLNEALTKAGLTTYL